MRAGHGFAAAAAAFFCATAATAIVPAANQDRSADPACSTPVETPVTTSHEMRSGGRATLYRAFAGQLPIRDLATGRLHACIFYVAYRIPPAAGAAPRPVTFIWGGGPSQPSATTDSSYLGPKRLAGGKLEDNPASLLAASDLVFADPVGTGYSRPTGADAATEFFTVKGDAASFAEAVRVWLKLYAPADTPLFLYGPSYGSWRAGVVTELLAKAGQHVTGTMLISGGILVGPDLLSPPEKAAYRVPAQAATAQYYGKLDPALGKDVSSATANAEAWIETTYLPALRRIADLSADERERIAHDLAHHTGYPAGRIDRRTLAFSQNDYRRSLLDDGREIDYLDMRTIKGGARPPEDAMSHVRYIRDELGYRTDLAYAGIESGYSAVDGPAWQDPGSQWRYDVGEGGPTPVDPLDQGVGPSFKGEPWIVRALDRDPRIRIFVGVGLFDSMNSCSGNVASVARVAPAKARQFTLRCYIHGHRMGIDPANIARLGGDLRDFIRDASIGGDARAIRP